MVGNLECFNQSWIYTGRGRKFILLPFMLENMASLQHISTCSLRITYAMNTKWFCPFCIPWICINIIWARVTLV